MRQCTPRYTVLIVGTLLVLVLNSCHKTNEDTASTKQYATLGNLQTAYSAEIRHYRWYTRFIQQAKTERLIYVADLFKAAARSEQIHADNHARQIRSLGGEPIEPPEESVPERKTYQTLRFALRTEQFECESLYPTMIRTAEVEKLSEVVKELRQTNEVDARQQVLFHEAVQSSGNIPHVAYLICPGCGYIVTSVKTEQCPVCSAKVVQLEKI